MTFPSSIEFTVTFPGDEGFFGRECNSPSCRRYFKVHIDSIRDDMHCPYCGERFPNDQLWTKDQISFAEKSAMHEVIPLLEKEVDDIFRRAFQGKKDWTYTPGSPRPRRRPPTPPKEKTVDSELACPECHSRFQVDGIFGYCPGCRAENLLLYDANLIIIKREIEAAVNHTRALRHAYNDLVSTFEVFTRKEAQRKGITVGRFQNLDHTRRLFRRELNIDILNGFTHDEIRHLKRVFEKRHVHEHNGGIVSERYIEEIPEDAQLLGTTAPLSVQELDIGATLLRRALSVLVSNR